MTKFKLNGYDSYSGCDVVVTARLNVLIGSQQQLKEKVYTLGSLQTLSISTHQDKKPVRVIGSANALDYTMGQRTIAGSLVFAVFDQHFATEMFNDLKESTGKDFLLPDELPALDLTISFANEYGRKSRMAIYGVRIINEGQVMSINDLYTENTYQFVALAMEPLTNKIEIGSSRARNIDDKIRSSIPEDLTSLNENHGEEIYRRTIISNTTLSSNISLTAMVEQPTYDNQDGIVKLYLSPNQKTGIISVLDRKKDKVIQEINVSSNANQYFTYLKAGSYSAWYHDNNQTLSNTALFTVNDVANFNYIYNDAPVIENVTCDSISALANNTHDTGVCIDVNTLEEFTTEINSRKFTFNNLKPNTTYEILTRLNDKNSKSTKTTTLEIENQFLIMYKDYVANNSKVLSKSFDNYKKILDSLHSDNFINDLVKDKSIEAKELIFLAIKYKNEFTSIVNQSNIDNMAIKKIDSVLGNSFKFNNGIVKANIFLNIKNKDYFEASEAYPNEITYTGRPNSLYNVVGINDNFIKSPKYTFYTYSDNDKNAIKSNFKDVNVLNSLEQKTLTGVRLSNDSLRCLTAKEYKLKDIQLLKAPSGYIVKDTCSLIAYTDYKDILGDKNKSYYLCISKLDECLDKTSFRKVSIDVTSESIILNNISTAINDKDIYAIWIEDELYNVISDLGFVSCLDDTIDLNTFIVKEELLKIVKKIEDNLSMSDSLSNIIESIDIEATLLKDVYKALALAFINSNQDDLSLIYELFKVQFSDIYVVKDKYKDVVYDKETNKVTFNSFLENSQLIHIAIKKNTYDVNVINSNECEIDDNYDVNILYMISNNPVIKSGFVYIDSNYNAISHLINLEVK